MSRGQKHLIRCRCVLPQFKKLENPPPHQFVVFSVLDDDENVVAKYAQCNNCGIIHKVTDVCKSEVLPTKENMNSLMKIEDIKSSLHPNFANVLEASFADLATWEATRFIVENKKWGEFAIMTTETEGEEIHGKYIVILSDSLCKVEVFTRSSGLLI